MDARKERHIERHLAIFLNENESFEARVVSGEEVWDAAGEEAGAIQLARGGAATELAACISFNAGSPQDGGQRESEIAMGIIANLASYASTRDATLATPAFAAAEELFVFSEYCGSLTEAARFFAAAAASGSGPQLFSQLSSDGNFLARLCFCLTSSTDFELLSRCCELLYLVVYRAREPARLASHLFEEHDIANVLGNLLQHAHTRDAMDAIAIDGESGLSYLIRSLEVLCSADDAAIRVGSPGGKDGDLGQLNDTWRGIVQSLAALLQPFEAPHGAQEGAAVVLSSCLQLPADWESVFAASAAAPPDSPRHARSGGDAVREFTSGLMALWSGLVHLEDVTKKEIELEAVTELAEGLSRFVQSDASLQQAAAQAVRARRDIGREAIDGASRPLGSLIARFSAALDAIVGAAAAVNKM